MSQKQIKPKKCRITHEELQKRFNQADLDGNGTLSADQITHLLQNLGFDDTYKGTIRKICRYLNKKKKLHVQLNQHQSPVPSSVLNETKNQTKEISQQNSQDEQQHKNQTQQEKKIRKQQQKKKQEEQAAITFEQFTKYFEILQKPIGKILYNASLQRSVKVAELCKQVNLKNMFHKDKGQKLKIKLLVGQEMPEYNYSLEVKLTKEPLKQQFQGVFKVEISVATISQQKALYLVNGLKEIYQMVIDLITAENQEFTDITEVMKLDGYAQGNIAKISITTTDEDMRQLIRDTLVTFDEILETQVTFLIRILYQFNFSLSQIKKNKNAVLQDIFARQCCIKFQYLGSQFLDALKQIALSKKVFQLLEYDTDPVLIMLLGFMSMEKGDILLKFKNLERKEGSRQLTNEIIAQIRMVNEFQTQNFSFQQVSNIVDGPITIKAQMQNVKLFVNIDIKDILKLPYMFDGSDHSDDDD